MSRRKNVNPLADEVTEIDSQFRVAEVTQDEKGALVKETGGHASVKEYQEAQERARVEALEQLAQTKEDRDLIMVRTVSGGSMYDHEKAQWIHGRPTAVYRSRWIDTQAAAGKLLVAEK